MAKLTSLGHPVLHSTDGYEGVLDSGNNYSYIDMRASKGTPGDAKFVTGDKK